MNNSSIRVVAYAKSRTVPWFEVGAELWVVL